MAVSAVRATVAHPPGFRNPRFCFVIVGYETNNGTGANPGNRGLFSLLMETPCLS